MAIETERGSMTGDEMVALTKRHTLFEWSAQSRSTRSRWPAPRVSISGRPRGSLPGLQQPADVHEYRPRRRSSPPSRSRRRPWPTPIRSATEPRALRREARRDHAGRHRHLLLHERGAEANENAIKLARFVTRPHKILSLSVISAAGPRGDQPHGDHASLGGRAGHPGRRPRPGSVPRHPARMGHGR